MTLDQALKMWERGAASRKETQEIRFQILEAARKEEKKHGH
jgi:exonuclease VII small subunit